MFSSAACWEQHVVGFVLAGLFLCHRPLGGLGRIPPAAQTSGRAPSDYLRMFGMGPVLITMGINGLHWTGLLLLLGGDLNGPTLGSLLPSWASLPLVSMRAILFRLWRCDGQGIFLPGRDGERVSPTGGALLHGYGPPLPGISAGSTASWPDSSTRWWY